MVPSLLKFLIQKEKVEAAIEELKKNREKLPDLVNASMAQAIKTKLGDRELTENEKRELEEIEQDLLRKHQAELNYRISVLQSMEEKVSAT